MYDVERELLYLPLDRSKLDQIELWRGDELVGAGVDAKVSHGRVLPAGTLVLKVCYAVSPGELGDCLIAIARALDTDPDSSLADVLAARARRVQRQDNGWLLVDLPSMIFPKQCCHCLQATSNYRMFRVDASTMSFWIPHCQTCVRANSWRYWRLLVGYAVVLTLALTFVAGLIGLILDLSGWSLPGQFMFTFILILCTVVLGGFVCCLPAHFIAMATTQPVRLRRYDPRAATVLIRIRNPECARIFAGETDRES
jgi:hypothetical protein